MMFFRILSWRFIKLLIRLRFPEVQQLSTEELAVWLQKEVAKPLLLDARTAEEYEVSHLLDARLVPNNLQDLVEEKINFSTGMVVYCSVGYRSSAIAHRLQAMGYQNV